MRITFDVDELQGRLAQLSAVAGAKTALLVFSHVLVQAAGAAVRLPARDADATLTVSLSKAKADGDVEALVPLARLTSIVGTFAPGEMSIDADGRTATVRCRKYKGVLSTIGLKELPPDLAADTELEMRASLGLPQLKEHAECVAFAVPDEAGKYIVPVARMEMTEGKLRTVSTDGQRLAVLQSDAKADDFATNIPKTALTLIPKLTGLDGGGPVTVSECDNALRFATATESLTVAKAAGRFPNYRQVMKDPAAAAAVITVDSRDELLAAVGRAKPQADKEHPTGVFAASKSTGSLGISAVSLEKTADDTLFRNMSDDCVDAKPTEDATFPLDLNMLTEFLKQAKGPINIRYFGAREVIDFEAAGGYRYLQMPVVSAPTEQAPAEPEQKKQ